MNHSLKIAGISIITSTAEAFNQNTIGQLWGEFAKQPIKEKLKSVISDNIFAVYSEYENKHHGKYRTTIGFAVDPASNIPAEFSTVIIPAGKYKTFEPKSSAPNDIITIWSEIWDMDSVKLPRNYVADFEEYAADGQVKIHIGII